MRLETLIDKCIDNNAAAQKELYQMFCGLLMGICVRYTNSTEEAEDMLQESFIKIFKSIHSLKTPEHLKAWMCKITVNTCIEFYKKRKKGLLLIDDFQDNVTADEEVFSTFSVKEILEAIQQLPNGYRLIFNLYEIEGYKHSEIADKLNITIGTSKSQLNRAKKLLQQYLERKQITLNAINE